MKELIEKLEANTCELTEEDALEILSTVTRQIISKEAACSYLNISRSKFDELVKEGKLPEGKKRRGFKEKFWYKDELDATIKNLR